MSTDWDWIFTYESLDGGLGQVAVAGHIDLDAFRAAFRQWLLTDGRQHVADDWQDIEELAALTPRHGYFYLRCGAPSPEEAPEDAWCTSDKCQMKITGDKPGFESADCELCQHECLWGCMEETPPAEGKSWPITYVSVNQP